MCLRHSGDNGAGGLCREPWRLQVDLHGLQIHAAVLHRNRSHSDCRSRRHPSRLSSLGYLRGTNMSRILIVLFVTAGLSLTGCAAQRSAPVTTASPMAPISKDAYDA